MVDMNYNAAVPPMAGATLAATGTDSLWLTLAGFAMVAVGAAMMRVLPARDAERAPEWTP